MQNKEIQIGFPIRRVHTVSAHYFALLSASELEYIFIRFCFGMRSDK